MSTWICPIDEAGRHRLELTRTGTGVELALQSEGRNDRSPLHHALVAQLAFCVGDRVTALDPVTDRAFIDGSTVSIALGHDPSLLLAELDDGGLSPRYRLSPFECRYLADNERPHPPAPVADGPALLTDLHTHFAGCVRPRDLLRIGIEAELAYPSHLLAKAGAHFPEATSVRLDQLGPGVVSTLAEALALPEDRQSTFAEMEAVYRFRAPITKAPGAFVSLLRRIAADYAAMGVRYAELSLFDVLRADVLRAIHRELPAIEAETRVQLRFLAALNRHDDFEWDLDLLDRIETLLPSGYLAGVDFMGHENNSTSEFAEVLRRLGRLAARARPGLVVRVHAGENPAYPENVRLALECLRGEPVEIRIGHGVYGVDDATLALIRETGAIVELNLNSNYALNNIQSSLEAPLIRYLDAGVKIVLGTDGYGIYGTNLASEVRAARLTGLDSEGLRAIAATEDELLAGRAKVVEPFDVPDDAPPSYYGPHVVARKAKAKADQAAALEARLSSLRLEPLTSEEVEARLRGKRVIAFAGAWKHSFARWSDATLAQVKDVLARILAGLDPEKCVLVTGGTRHGVEGLIHELAQPLGHRVLGALIRAVPPQDIDDHLGHAALIAETFYDKAAALYRLVDRHDGFAIFVGGGPIVGDEIQTAVNLKLRHLLFDGPEGASTDHARHAPGRAFRDPEQALLAIHDDSTRRGHQAPYWHAGPNPTVDLLITRDRPGAGGIEVLLIQRDWNAASEPGKWALPGGFVQTDAPRGAAWAPGKETTLQAGLRELHEETGLDLGDEAERLVSLGTYEGGGRDPRDTERAWSRTEVFGRHLSAALQKSAIVGGDDARDAAWFAIGALPLKLAFDHRRIIAECLATLHGSPSTPKMPP